MKYIARLCRRYLNPNNILGAAFVIVVLLTAWAKW